MTDETRSSQTPVVKRSRRNLPLVLIGIGLLILIANAGTLGSILWSVVWPIGLIAVGIDLITEGRDRRRIGIGALLGVLVLSPLIGGAQLVDQGRERVEIANRPGGEQRLGLVDVDRVRAQVRQTAGSLRIEALDEDSQDAARVEHAEQQLDYRIEDRIAILEIAPDQGWGGGELDLRLTQRVPLDLTIDVAAGSASPLDFEELQLERLDLTVNAGEAEVKLPDHGVMDVTVAGGVGSIEIEVPDDLNARIEIDSGIGEAEYDEDRFQEQDGVLLSNDYDAESPNHATIRITSSASRIAIK